MEDRSNMAHVTGGAWVFYENFLSFYVFKGLRTEATHLLKAAGSVSATS